MSEQELAAWVERSCVEQGVPVKITDPRTVRDAAVLLGAVSPERRTRQGRRAGHSSPQMRQTG